MRRPVSLLALIFAAVAILAAGWHFSMAPASPAADDSEAEEAWAPTALVKTAAVRRERLAAEATVFGEVVLGQPHSVGFAQAGQIASLQVVPGQRVRRGEVLASLVNDPNSQAAYAQAASALGVAQREFKRVQALFDLQLATQGQVDAAGKQLQDAESLLQAQSRLGGGAGVAQLQAPFDAWVMAVQASSGDRLAAGSSVLQLGRCDDLWARLSIDPALANRLRLGMPVRVHAVQDRERQIVGSLDTLQELIDPATRLFSARVQLPTGAQANLLPGLQVQARIVLDEQESWVVPRQAVLADAAGSYLYQVAGNQARRVPVSVRAEQDDILGVEGSLEAALPVVVLGNYELQDGMAVREERP